MTVIIGMDPHKRSATIEIIDPSATVLAAGRYSTDTAGYQEMLVAARQFAERVWAIEGCNGRGSARPLDGCSGTEPTAGRQRSGWACSAPMPSRKTRD